MRDKRNPTFPLPFARKPAPAREIQQCRRADMEPVLLAVPLRVMLEILRMRIRAEKRELGTMPKGYELN